MARDYTGRIVKETKVMSLGAKVALLTIGILFLLAAITAPLVVLMSKESRGTISSGDFIYQYNIENGNVYYDIKKYIGQNTENVVIPSEYNGAPVVGILKGAFNGNSSNVVKNIKRISFDTTNFGGISRIDPEAFIGLISLTGLDLPSHITTIHNNAFLNCKINGDVNVADLSVYYDTGVLKTIKLSEGAFNGSTATGALNIANASSNELIPSEILKSFGTLGVSAVNLSKSVNIYNLGFESFKNYTNVTEMTVYTDKKPNWLVEAESAGRTSYDVQRNLDLSACTKLKTLNVLYGNKEEIESSLTQKFLRASKLEVINFGDGITKIGGDTLSNDDSGRGFDSLKKIVVSTNIKTESEGVLRWKTDEQTHSDNVNIISSNKGISIDINMMKASQYSDPSKYGTGKTFEVYFKDAETGYYYLNTKTNNVEGDFASLEIEYDSVDGKYKTSYNKQKPDGNTLVHKLIITRDADKDSNIYLSGITSEFMSIFKNASLIRELDISPQVKGISDRAFKGAIFNSTAITPQNYNPGEGLTLRFLTKADDSTAINSNILTSIMFGDSQERISNVDVYGPSTDASVIYNAFNSSEGAYSVRHTYNGNDELSDLNYLLSFNSNLSKDSVGFNGVLEINSNYGANMGKTVEEDTTSGLLQNAYKAKNGTTISLPYDKNQSANEWVIVGWYNTAACNDDDPKLIPNAQNKVDFVVDPEQDEYNFSYVKRDKLNLRELTLYAKWERKPYINVSLDLREQEETTAGKLVDATLYPIGATYGADAGNTIRAEYGSGFGHLILIENDGVSTTKTSKTQMPVAYQAGFQFAGWYTKPNGQGVHVTEETILNKALFKEIFNTITNETTEDEIIEGIGNGNYDITLYAHYTKINFRVVYHAVPGANEQGTSAIFNAAYGGLVPSAQNVIFDNSSFTYFTNFVAEDFTDIGFDSGWLTFIGYTYQKDTLIGSLETRLEDAGKTNFDYNEKDIQASIWKDGVLGAKLLNVLYDYEDGNGNINLNAAIFNGADIFLYCQYVPKTITISYEADEYTTTSPDFEAQKEFTLYLADDVRTAETEQTSFNILNGAPLLEKVGYTYGETNGNKTRGWRLDNSSAYNVGDSISAAALVEDADYKIGSITSGTNPADDVTISLNAVFRQNALTIKYNANEGTFESGAQFLQNVNYSTSFNLMQVDKVSKTGCILVGWSLYKYNPAVTEITNHNFMLKGNTAPNNSDGENGYYYLNESNNALYRKESGAWVEINNDIATTVGVDAPSAATELDEGKYYVDTTAWLIYKAVTFNNGQVNWVKLNNINNLFSKNGAVYTLIDPSNTAEMLLVEANLRYPTALEAQEGTNITLYAVWEYEVYNLTLNVGVGANISTTVTYGQTYTNIDLTGYNKTGKVFDGFYTQDNGVGTQIYAGGGTEGAWQALARRSNIDPVEYKLVYDLGNYAIDSNNERSTISAVLSANWANETYTVTYTMRQYVGASSITAQGILHDPKGNAANVQTTFATSLSDGASNPLAFVWEADENDNTADFVFVRYTIKHAADNGEDVLAYTNQLNLAVTEEFISDYANANKQINIFVDVRAKVYELAFAVDSQSTYGPVKEIVKPNNSYNDYVAQIVDGASTIGFKVYVIRRNNFNMLVPTSYFETTQDANNISYVVASRTTVFENLKTNIAEMPVVTLYNGNFNHYTYNEQNYTPVSIVSLAVPDAGADLSVIDIEIVDKDYNKTNIELALESPDEEVYKSAWLVGALDRWEITGTYAEGGIFNLSGTTTTIPNIRQNANITLTVYVKDGFRIGNTIDGSNTQNTSININPVVYEFTNGDNYTTSQTIKVYGVKFEVKYNGGADATGTMENSTYRVVGEDAQILIADVDSLFVLSENQFSRLGYTFLGWQDEEDKNSQYITYFAPYYHAFDEWSREPGTGYVDGIKNLTTTENAVVNIYAAWGTYNINNEPQVNVSHDYTLVYSPNTPTNTTAPATTISVGGLNFEDDTILALAENNYAVVGYTNVGKWFYDAACTHEVASYTNVAVRDLVTTANGHGQNTEENHTVTLYTKWEVKHFNIYYKDNGANEEIFDDQNIAFGALFNPTTIITRNGYAFDGWCQTNNVVLGTAAPSSDIGENGYYYINTSNNDLYLRNNGTWGILNKTTDTTIPSNAAGTSGDYYLNTSTYEIYRKASIWLLQNNGTGTPVNWETVPDLGADGTSITLYAQWMQETYSIEFNANEGTSVTTLTGLHYGDDITINATTPSTSKTGYTFLGWCEENDSVSGTGTGVIVDWDSVPDLGDNGAVKTLYACWQIITYNINYKAPNGNDVETLAGVSFAGTGRINTYTIEDIIDIPAITRTGWVFAGWFSDNTLETPATTHIVHSTGDITVYAKFTEAPYTINYELYGGTHLEELNSEPRQHPTEHIYGEDTALNGATKVGYNFSGWWLASKTIVAAVAPTTEGNDGDYYYDTSDNSLYVKEEGIWELIGTYVAELTKREADAEPDGTYYVYYNGSYSVYEKVAGNWNLISTNTALTTLGATDFNANINLYAKWTAIPIGQLVDKDNQNVVLTLDLNVPSLSGTTTAGFGSATNWTINGTTATNNSIEFGSKIGTLPVPSVVNAGYDITFLGWNYSYYDTELEQVVNKEKQTTYVIENLVYNFVDGEQGKPASITIEAQWKVETNTFSLVLDFNGSDYADYNGARAIFEQQTETELFNGTYTPTHDQYGALISETLTFRLTYGASLDDVLSIVAGRYGTTFIGWFDAQNHTATNQVGTQYTGGYMPASDLTLYAIFGEDYYDDTSNPDNNHNETDPSKGKYQRYQIQFKENVPETLYDGTSVTKPADITEVWGDESATIDVATLIGHTFNGWGFSTALANGRSNLLSSGTKSMHDIIEAAIKAGVNVEAGHIIQLYASWTMNVYSIFLHNNYDPTEINVPGSVSFMKESLTMPGTYEANYYDTMPSPGAVFSRDGYTAGANWALDAGGTVMLNSLTNDVYYLVNLAKNNAGQTPDVVEYIENQGNVNALHFYVVWTAKNIGQMGLSLTLVLDTETNGLNSNSHFNSATGWDLYNALTNPIATTSTAVIFDSPIGYNSIPEAIGIRAGYVVELAGYTDGTTTYTPAEFAALVWTFTESKTYTIVWSLTKQTLADFTGDDGSSDPLEFTIDLNNANANFVDNNSGVNSGTIGNYAIDGTMASTSALEFDSPIGTIPSFVYGRTGYTTVFKGFKLYKYNATTDSFSDELNNGTVYKTKNTNIGGATDYLVDYGNAADYLEDVVYSFKFSVTAKAQWDITSNEYDIEYKDKSNIDYSGDNYNDLPKKFVFGNGITLTPGEKRGYTFLGWFDDSACETTVISAIAANDVNFAQNITLYAKWQVQTYNIIYRDQDDENFSGTHASGYPTSHTYDAQTTLTGATKTGYTFDGWFDTSACTGSARTTIGAKEITADITLYAKWTAQTLNSLGVTFTLDLNESELTNKDIEASFGEETGYTKNLTSTITSSNSQTAITFDGEIGIIPSISISKTGYYVADPTWKLYVEDTNTEITAANMPANNAAGRVKVDNEYTTLELQNLVYDFVDATTGEVISVTAKAVWANPVAQKVKVTVYHKLQTINGTFVTDYYDVYNDDDPSNTESINNDNFVADSPNHLISGLVNADYMGWTNGFNYTKATFEDNFNSTAQTTFTAAADGGTEIYIWYARAQYTIVFNANGGTTVESMQNVYYEQIVGVSATAPNTSKDGYTFYGWCETNDSTNNTGTGTPVNWSVEPGVPNLGASGTTKNLYAKWTQETYSIEFNTNGGTSVESWTNLHCGDVRAINATTPSTSKPGYAFLGWCEENDSVSGTGTGEIVVWYNVPDLGTDGAVKTLYAKWLQETYSIVFNANGGNGVATMSNLHYGDVIAINTTMPSTTRDGYVFAGWCETNNVVLGTTAPDNSVGEDGYYYINTTNNDLYLKASGAWGILNKTTGTTAPSSSAGTSGDYYLNTSTYEIYRKASIWLLQNNGTGTPVNWETVPDLGADGTSITLYAQWMQETYSIEFNTNEGTSVTTLTGLHYGDVIAINATTPSTSKTGYVLKGWCETNDSINKTGTGEIVVWDSVPDLGADGTVKTLYAKWVKQTYTIVFDSYLDTTNGGVSPGVEVTNKNGVDNVIDYGGSLAFSSAADLTFTTNGGTYKIVSWILSNNKNYNSFTITENPELIEGASSVTLNFAPAANSWFNALGLDARNDENVIINATAQVQLRTFTVGVGMYFADPITNAEKDYAGGNNAYCEVVGKISNTETTPVEIFVKDSSNEDYPVTYTISNGVVEFVGVKAGTTLESLLNGFTTNINGHLNLTTTIIIDGSSVVYNEEDLTFAGFTHDSTLGSQLTDSYNQNVELVTEGSQTFGLYFKRNVYRVYVNLDGDIYTSGGKDNSYKAYPLTTMNTNYEFGLYLSADLNTSDIKVKRSSVDNHSAFYTTYYNTGAILWDYKVNNKTVKGWLSDSSAVYRQGFDIRQVVDTSNSDNIYFRKATSTDEYINNLNFNINSSLDLTKTATGIGTTRVLNLIVSWYVNLVTVYFDPLDGTITTETANGATACEGTNALGKDNNTKYKVQVPRGTAIGGLNGLLPVATASNNYGSSVNSFLGWYSDASGFDQSYTKVEADQGFAFNLSFSNNNTLIQSNGTTGLYYGEDLYGTNAPIADPVASLCDFTFNYYGEIYQNSASNYITINFTIDVDEEQTRQCVEQIKNINDNSFAPYNGDKIYLNGIQIYLDTEYIETIDVTFVYNSSDGQFHVGSSSGATSYTYEKITGITDKTDDLHNVVIDQSGGWCAYEHFWGSTTEFTADNAAAFNIGLNIDTKTDKSGPTTTYFNTRSGSASRYNAIADAYRSASSKANGNMTLYAAYGALITLKLTNSNDGITYSNFADSVADAVAYAQDHLEVIYGTEAQKEKVKNLTTVYSIGLDIYAKIPLYALRGLSNSTERYYATFLPYSPLKANSVKVFASYHTSASATTANRVVASGATAAGSSQSASTDKTFHAHYVEAAKVNFYAVGTTTPDLTVYVEKGKAFSTAQTGIPVYKRLGSTLAGWYTNSNGTGNALSTTTIINDDVNYYAKWQSTTTYTVTFYQMGTNGQLSAAKTVKINSGDNFDTAAGYKSTTYNGTTYNYSFPEVSYDPEIYKLGTNNWLYTTNHVTYLDADALEAAIIDRELSDRFSSNSTISYDINVYPNLLQYYTIIFETDDGVIKTMENVVAGESIKIPVPTASNGLRFIGWTWASGDDVTYITRGTTKPSNSGYGNIVYQSNYNVTNTNWLPTYTALRYIRSGNIKDPNTVHAFWAETYTVNFIVEQHKNFYTIPSNKATLSGLCSGDTGFMPPAYAYSWDGEYEYGFEDDYWYYKDDTVVSGLNTSSSLFTIGAIHMHRHAYQRKHLVVYFDLNGNGVYNETGIDSKYVRTDPIVTSLDLTQAMAYNPGSYYGILFRTLTSGGGSVVDNTYYFGDSDGYVTNKIYYYFSVHCVYMRGNTQSSTIMGTVSCSVEPQQLSPAEMYWFEKGTNVVNVTASVADSRYYVIDHYTLRDPNNTDVETVSNVSTIAMGEYWRGYHLYFYFYAKSAQINVTMKTGKNISVPVSAFNLYGSGTACKAGGNSDSTTRYISFWLDGGENYSSSTLTLKVSIVLEDGVVNDNGTFTASSSSGLMAYNSSGYKRYQVISSIYAPYDWVVGLSEFYYNYNMPLSNQNVSVILGDEALYGTLYANQYYNGNNAIVSSNAPVPKVNGNVIPSSSSGGYGQVFAGSTYNMSITYPDNNVYSLTGYSIDGGAVTSSTSAPSVTIPDRDADSMWGDTISVELYYSCSATCGTTQSGSGGTLYTSLANAYSNGCTSVYLYTEGTSDSGASVTLGSSSLAIRKGSMSGITYYQYGVNVNVGGSGSATINSGVTVRTVQINIAGTGSITISSGVLSYYPTGIGVGLYGSGSVINNSSLSATVGINTNTPTTTDNSGYYASMNINYTGSISSMSGDAPIKRGSKYFEQLIINCNSTAIANACATLCRNQKTDGVYQWADVEVSGTIVTCSRTHVL